MARTLAPKGAAVIPVPGAGPMVAQASSLVVVGPVAAPQRETAPSPSAHALQETEPIGLTPDEAESPLGQFMKRHANMDSARRDTPAERGDSRPSWYNPE